jgi:membrane-associated phospholipid phosphatase
VAAFACYRVHRVVGVAAIIWAGLIGVSTVYTKQHYVVDVPAGVALALVAYRARPRIAYARACNDRGWRRNSKVDP